MFATSMQLLCQYNLDKMLLSPINEILDIFVQQTEQLYGSDNIKINVHQLLHLIESDVENWGLLWTHNSFIYESMNGVLSKFIHGTKLFPAAALHALSCVQQIALKEKHVQFTNEEALNLFRKFQKEKIK